MVMNATFLIHLNACELAHSFFLFHFTVIELLNMWTKSKCVQKFVSGVWFFKDRKFYSKMEFCTHTNYSSHKLLHIISKMNVCSYLVCVRVRICTCAWQSWHRHLIAWLVVHKQANKQKLFADNCLAEKLLSFRLFRERTREMKRKCDAQLKHGVKDSIFSSPLPLARPKARRSESTKIACQQ